MKNRRIMTEKEFNKLKHRDFTNGAVLDEISDSLRERETLEKELVALKQEHENLKNNLKLAIKAATFFN